jgi:hypothetical protein
VLDDEADGDVEPVLVVDDVGGLVAVAEAVVVLAVGVGVTPSLSTVKAARRMELARCDHFRTAVIVCRPSASFAVSKARAERSNHSISPPEGKKMRNRYLDHWENQSADIVDHQYRLDVAICFGVQHG